VTRPQSKFLIDECLSPALAAHARERGFVAEHVNDVKRRRKKGRLSDRQVANYALERDLIVVTNNMVDFKEIYISKMVHPGLVFLACPIDDLFTLENQVTLFGVAIDLIEENEPLQEAILVTLNAEDDDELDIDTSRHELPKH
jgi:predicted nuclease of predicted toxin-antitoxin system